MSTKPKILILSAPVGTGHQVAAAALAQEALRNGAEVVTKDVFSCLPKVLVQIILSAYSLLLRWWPEGYALIYGWGNTQKGSLNLRGWINHFLSWRLHAFIKNVQPQLVLVTHATPAGIMADYKMNYAPDLYVAGVITDFVVHKWWLYPGINTYFVATEKVAESLLNLSAALPAAPEIVVSGIPVRRHFSRLTYLYARERFHWQPGTMVCLLIGGGAGILPMEAILEKVTAAYPQHLQLVAVTGTNTDLAASLNQFPGVTVYGYTELFPDLLIGADIVVTKAGGLTLAEALAAGTEIILYKPLPGQERGNTDYFLEQGLASLAHNPDEVLRYLQNYQHLPESARAARLQKRQQLARPLATQKIFSWLREHTLYFPDAQ